MTTISAILTFHGEFLLGGPTIRSAEAAAAAAEAAGHVVERLIGMDRPTPETAAYLRTFEARGWRLMEADCGDQGAARNLYAAASTGDLIAFLDGDDLWSENWLTEGARLIAAHGPKTIAHPELNWFFGEAAAIHVNLDQDHPLFDPRHFVFRNFYDALSMAPRAAHLDLPFAARELKRGYAFEDMQWAIESMLAGYVHRVAPETIIFKRRRPGSQNTRALARGVAIRDLPALKIDRLEELAAYGWAPQKTE